VLDRPDPLYTRIGLKKFMRIIERTWTIWPTAVGGIR